MTNKKIITNRQLLEHMQGMKYELQMQIHGIDTKIDRLKQSMDRQFLDSRLHREALQQEWNTTKKDVAQHEKRLARG
jgi:predicted  nucleic acid-binding Zn-ribbon protein